jgi:chorismate synthase
MKPIPTLARPLASVDLATKEAFVAQKERTDSCAVPALAVIAEAAVAFVLADALLEKTGGDSLAEVQRNLGAYRDALARY